MTLQVVISKAGDPSVLVDREQEHVEVGPGQVRIDVAAAGVNFADVVGRLGNYPDAPPIPYCPGYEVAGTVSEVGPGVESVAVGDRVCALTRFGGYSHEIVTDAVAVYRVPGDVALDLAAALPVTYLTAHTCLFDAGCLTPGKTVLIQGGAGGVGTAAIQLALRVPGVTIIATAGGREKSEWLRSHGVHHPIDYTAEDVAKRVAELTQGLGVDVVLDPLGGRHIQQSVAMCRPLGRVVAYGVSSMNPGRKRQIMPLVRGGLAMRYFNLLPPFDRSVGVHAINMLHVATSDPSLARSKMDEILGLVSKGELRPVLAKTLELCAAGAREAHEYLHARKNIGKIVLAGTGRAVPG